MIRHISLTNFMNLDEEYNLHDPGCPSHKRTQVTGGSGTGKTRLAQAISFALGGSDLSGNTRPHHLVSADSLGATVSITLDRSIVISRTLHRKTRSITVLVHQKGQPTCYDLKVSERVMGFSRYGVLSAVIPGFFVRMSTIRKRLVYNELFKVHDLRLPDGMKLQRHFDCRVINSKGKCYEEFTAEQRTDFDFTLCYETHRLHPNPINCVVVDDATNIPWSDVSYPPKYIQLIEMNRVSKAPLEIRY